MVKNLLLLLILVLAQSAFAKTWNVNISSLPAEDKVELLKRFNTIEKERISAEKIDEMIKFLQLNPNNEIVQAIEEKEDTIILVIKNSKKISQINIKGTKNLSSDDILNVFQIKKNDKYDQQSLIEGGERIKIFYKDRGYLNTTLDIEAPTDNNNQIILNISIVENSLTTINDIKILSVSEELNSTINRLLNKRKNKAFTEPAINEIQKDIKEYLKKYNYYRADVSNPEIKLSADETKANIAIKIDHVESYNITVTGNNKINTSDIKYEILDLENFHTTNTKITTEMIEKIRLAYLAKGYARVEIQAEETEDKKPYSKNIELLINEGPLVLIDKISINGRTSKSAEYYSNFIKTHSSKILKDGVFCKEDLEIGLHNLIIELQNQGYLLAKITSTRSQFNKEKNKVSFYVNLDEGPLTEIESIEFSGNATFTASNLMQASELQSSGPLHLNQIEKAVAQIKSYYQDNGFIEMQILNEKEGLVTYSENNTKAKLNFNIYEGPQVRVGSILIDGNIFTKDFVVLNELEFTVGDIVTLAKIEESISRLQKTGFFNFVDIRTLEAKTNVANRTIIVKISEREPGLVNAGLGATNERTLTTRGYVGLAYRNIGGRGWGYSTRAEVNYNVTDVRYPESKITLGAVVPYLFNSRVRGRINLSRSKTVSDYDLKKVSEVNQTTYSLEKDFTTHVTGAWDVYSIATVHDFGLDPSKGVQDSLLDIGSTGTSLDIDYRDNPFNPSRGTLTQLAAEYADSNFLRSSTIINYRKTTAGFSHYFKINDTSVVWANSIRGGYLENLNHDPGGGVPYDKKGFILGGRSTIRGYEAASIEVFPNRIDLGTDSYLLTTNATMGLYKSEFRFPVYGNFGMAVFYDAGYVSISGLDFNDKFRDSTGFGIRYNTPVGPLNLEWGWKLRRHPGEDPWRFHLSIGTF